MAVKFEWDGETFELLHNTDKWTIGEVRAVERAFGVHVEDMGMLDQMAAAIAVSIKRVRPTFRIADVENIPMELVGQLMEQSAAAAREADAGPPPGAPGGEEAAAASE